MTYVPVWLDDDVIENFPTWLRGCLGIPQARIPPLGIPHLITQAETRIMKIVLVVLVRFYPKLEFMDTF
jgi:hypothetical protein